jgi:DNA-binding NtrC family response regulator
MATKRNAWRRRHVVDGPPAMTTRVQVVDDEPHVELFRQQFRWEVREGLYRLDFALSAETASHMLYRHASEEIILLVSGINMPEMSGFDLSPIVKARCPDLPVFMISAYGGADTVNTARECGLKSSSPSRWTSPDCDRTS